MCLCIPSNSNIRNVFWGAMFDAVKAHLCPRYEQIQMEPSVWTLCLTLSYFYWFPESFQIQTNIAVPPVVMGGSVTVEPVVKSRHDQSRRVRSFTKNRTVWGELKRVGEKTETLVWQYFRKRVKSGKGKAEDRAKPIYHWTAPSSGCIAIVKSTGRYVLI